MLANENILVYINHVRQMASVLESIGVLIDDKELAMAVLNGLPEHYQPIITALDAIGDERDSFTLEKVRSRLLQEEKKASSDKNTPSVQEMRHSLIEGVLGLAIISGRSVLTAV
eukprot:IDg10547t1